MCMVYVCMCITSIKGSAGPVDPVCTMLQIVVLQCHHSSNTVVVAVVVADLSLFVLLLLVLVSSILV